MTSITTPGDTEFVPSSHQQNELDRLAYRWPGAVEVVGHLAGTLVVSVNGKHVSIPREP